MTDCFPSSWAPSPAPSAGAALAAALGKGGEKVGEQTGGCCCCWGTRGDGVPAGGSLGGQRDRSQQGGWHAGSLRIPSQPSDGSRIAARLRRGLVCCDGSGPSAVRGVSAAASHERVLICGTSVCGLFK